MKKFLFTLLMAILILPVQVSAQTDDAEEFSLKDALAQIKTKKKELPLSIEARLNEKEIIFRYKKFFVDYNHIDKDKNLNYINLKVNNEIISMMGSGLEWSYGLTGVSWKDGENKFAPVPTLGLELYITVRPKVKIYTQFSGMPVGGLGRIYDAETGVRYSPSKHFTITAGYRHLNAKVRRQGSNGGFKNSGYFIGIRSDF